MYACTAQAVNIKEAMDGQPGNVHAPYAVENALQLKEFWEYDGRGPPIGTPPWPMLQ
jgi:hypothetical protein